MTRGASSTVLLADLWEQHRIPEHARVSGGFSLGVKDTRALDRGLNAIAPVSFAQVGGTLVGSCYPMLTGLVREHLLRYAEEPFSAEALDVLHRRLCPYLAEWGYRPSLFPERWICSLMAGEDYRAPEGVIFPGTRLLEMRDLRLVNRTSMKASDCIRRSAFAHLCDGEILAVAAVNMATEKTHCREIGVECAKDYRRKGYGLSCVCALAEHLHKRGEAVLYQHYVTNTASGALALRAGLTPVGGAYVYTAMR